MEQISYLLEWTEKHPGLGGWVGAVGAVIAIFVTWGLARAEYARTRRREEARVKSEIKLIMSVVLHFQSETIFPFTDAVESGGEGGAYYSQVLNDPNMSGMRDLAGIAREQKGMYAVFYDTLKFTASDRNHSFRLGRDRK
jgi:hypothetical protein